MSAPLARIRLLLDPERLTHEPVERDGVLDIGTAPTVSSPGQRLMRFPPYAWIYEWFRPIAYRVATGLSGPDLAEDRTRASDTLRLTEGSTVLDVACGPGNFTGHFGAVVGPTGLAVGYDASETMLRRAVTGNDGPSVGYVKGDAADLPFAAESFDAVSCFAALYLMDDPRAVLAECARVLRPGGRLAILTSYDGGAVAVRGLTHLSGWASGVRFFGRDEVTGWLDELGLTDIDQELDGLVQTVTATNPQGTGP